jgi:DNA adenine methylase
MTVMPVSRVFGAKARVAPLLIALMPPRVRVYVEVFAGSAAVLLQKPPHTSEHVNDMDGDIVNLFRCMRHDEALQDLCHIVSLTPWAEAEFLQIRESPTLSERLEGAGLIDQPDVERAWKYLVRSWQGVSGDDPAGTTGWRYDKTANKVVAKQWDHLPKRLQLAAARLKLVHVHQKPAIDMVDRFGQDKNTILFVDPPYPLASINTHGKGAYRHLMTDQEHENMACSLLACKAAVIVTMAKNTVYGRVLERWYQTDLTVKGLRNADKAEHVYCNFRPDGPLFHT